MSYSTRDVRLRKGSEALLPNQRDIEFFIEGVFLPHTNRCATTINRTSESQSQCEITTEELTGHRSRDTKAIPLQPCQAFRNRDDVRRN